MTRYLSVLMLLVAGENVFGQVKNEAFVETAKLNASDGEEIDYFGASVAISGD